MRFLKKNITSWWVRQAETHLSVRENVISGRLNCLFQTLYPLEAAGNLTPVVDMIRVFGCDFLGWVLSERWGKWYLEWARLLASKTLISLTGLRVNNATHESTPELYTHAAHLPINTHTHTLYRHEYPSHIQRKQDRYIRDGKWEKRQRRM